MALADRRRERIVEWIRCNTVEFQEDGDVQKLRSEAIATLAEVKQSLLLCSSKCVTCFLLCVLEKGHPGLHTCRGKHYCSEVCTFCLEEQSAGLQCNECGDLSGHEGLHDCKCRSHTCAKVCSLHKSSNCNRTCAMKPGHAGDHRCNTKQHLCAEKCTLPECRNLCTISVDGGQHDDHICHERMCPMTCIMDGCNRKCRFEDHFHLFTSARHFCGNEHTCKEQCEADGVCEIVTEVVKNKVFDGKQSRFDYEYVSEQNGVRKACCIPIPPWKEKHEGRHCHAVNPKAVHLCTTRCPACAYFCNRPIGHLGLHDTAHGDMRNVNFVAESEDIDLVEWKYARGESGVAEMCMMHCKTQGRGHLHSVRCGAHDGSKGQFSGLCKEGVDEGARRQTGECGPDTTAPKTAMTHKAYWKYLRFKDPCQAQDQRPVTTCRSEDHASATATSQQGSYCTEKLWHNFVSSTGSSTSEGYATEDETVGCNQVKNAPCHLVFVIDRSSSMGATDVKPTLAKFAVSFNNRLGCVYEAVTRFIRTRIAGGQPDLVSIVLFRQNASIAVERQPISEKLLDGLPQHSRIGGGAIYSCGLDLVQQILQRASADASMLGKQPAVIFLSGGAHCGETDPVAMVKKMRNRDNNLVFHTILFPADNKDEETLQRMAAFGAGKYQVCIDEVQLAGSLEGLAKSLSPQVASLIVM